MCFVDRLPGSWIDDNLGFSMGFSNGLRVVALHDVTNWTCPDYFAVRMLTFWVKACFGRDLLP